MNMHIIENSGVRKRTEEESKKNDRTRELTKRHPTTLHTNLAIELPSSLFY